MYITVYCCEIIVLLSPITIIVHKNVQEHNFNVTMCRYSVAVSRVICDYIAITKYHNAIIHIVMINFTIITVV